MTNRYNFFKIAIKNIKTSGTITPSSRFLAKKMLRKIDFSKAEIIVELGPGNGKITKKILSKLNSKAKLICFEINDHFYNELKKIEHSQLIVLNKSAETVKEELEKLGYSKSCHIVSSLPLTNIPDAISQSILHNSYASLEENGTFVQYQYTPTYFKKLKKVFHKGMTLDFEVLNVPPAFIYRCKKVV
ncbi:rRNA adenine N-6-methyltransferase family protein [Pseudotenacibaculum sp. MALMAid0570]|uniref:class I SAM-dependent methyltransferase n=1 Tax=Pseudotenacibaculum sp. MALMAid0570 TaxID=3143938 RepID=UPI0032E05233